MNQSATPPSPFRVLQHQLADVYLRWRIWKQLFVSASDENFRLMNLHAASFFGLAEQAMFDDIALRLCKLADPAEGGPAKARRPNLVLAAAFDEAKTRLGPKAVEVERLLAELADFLKPLRKMRNRAIAHLDKATALKAEPLQDIPFATIEKALETANVIMEHLEPPNHAFMYTDTIAPGDGESLLQALRWAEQHVQDERTKRLHGLKLPTGRQDDGQQHA